MIKSEKHRLEEAASNIFAPGIFEGLKIWYKYVLEDSWRYVVFAVRRSYILALIMEIITGKEMEKNSNAIFLTDAAFFLRCSELAEYYRKERRFPNILMCDDVLIHGRNINHIIHVMEDELCRILCVEYDKEEVISALAEAIKIHVYMRTWDLLLLDGRYGWNLHFVREEKPAVWHQLASDIATFIACANVTNAAYIYTEYISDNAMESVALDEYIYTRYQNMEQYSKCIYVGNDNDVKAILSLRLIKNVHGDGYRAAPFVFLPNLNAEETDLLFEEIVTRIPEDVGEWLKDLRKLYGMRSFNEITALLLSNVILQEFNRANNIICENIDFEKELIKLSRNYAKDGLETTQKILKMILAEPIFTVQEMEELLEEIIPENRIIMKLKSGPKYGYLTAEKQEKIKKNVEDYFYAEGYLDEMSAFELIKLPYFPTIRRSKRRVRGCCFALEALNEGYTMLKSKYCMSYVLQMMDIGVIGISSYAPKEMDVVGFSQFVKAGEQSLLLEPLRWDLYIPMLARMQFECNRWRISFIDELMEYGTAYPEMYSPELLEGLVRFVKILKKIGQTPDDWSGNYVDRIDLNRVGNGISTLYEYVSKQKEYREHYKAYAREKFYYI